MGPEQLEILQHRDDAVQAVAASRQPRPRRRPLELRYEWRAWWVERRAALDAHEGRKDAA